MKPNDKWELPFHLSAGKTYFVAANADDDTHIDLITDGGAKAEVAPTFMFGDHNKGLFITPVKDSTLKTYVKQLSSHGGFVTVVLCEVGLKSMPSKDNFFHTALAIANDYNLATKNNIHIMRSASGNNWFIFCGYLPVGGSFDFDVKLRNPDDYAITAFGDGQSDYFTLHTYDDMSDLYASQVVIGCHKGGNLFKHWPADTPRAVGTITNKDGSTSLITVLLLATHE